MLIVCPSCASRYELDVAKLGAEGRKVRCPACQTSWHVSPDQDFPEPPSGEETQALLNAELEQAATVDAQVTAVAAEREEEARAEQETVLPEPAKSPGGFRSRLPGRKARAAAAGGLASRGLAIPAAVAAACLVLASGLLWKRELAVRAAPQLAIVYQAIGLPVNLRGLALSSVESNLIEETQGRFLVVEGDVTNIARGANAVPLIEVAVKDAQGRTLYTWTTEPPRQKLEPAELIRFRARLASPPEEGRSVTVRFVSPQQGGAASLS
ncbi:MAG: hypothetical protein DI527_07210 [Chelatococcus sp.]|nr:MAG: hypothetical protein DI527_07210 [Chelatococcus sp.]